MRVWWIFYDCVCVMMRRVCGFFDDCVSVCECVVRVC